MTDIAESVTEKLGPLPVWAWGGIAAGVSLGAYYLYKRTHPTVTTDASGGSLVQAPATSDGTAYTTSGIPTSTQANTLTTSDSITAWIMRAATSLSGQSGLSPSDVIATLTHWWEGDTLTSAQKTVVDRAIQLQGQPPELPQAISAIKDPTPTSTPTPTPPAAVKFSGYIKNRAGTFAALYSDGTRKDFTNTKAYSAFLVKHPGVPTLLDDKTFYGHTVTGTNPTS